MEQATLGMDVDLDGVEVLSVGVRRLDDYLVLSRSARFRATDIPISRLVSVSRSLRCTADVSDNNILSQVSEILLLGLLSLSQVNVVGEELLALGLILLSLVLVDLVLYCLVSLHLDFLDRLVDLEALDLHCNLGSRHSLFVLVLLLRVDFE